MLLLWFLRLWHTVCLNPSATWAERFGRAAPRTNKLDCAGPNRPTKWNFRGVDHMPTYLTRRQALVLPAGVAVGSLVGRSATAAEPVKIGLVAALSGPSAKSGEGITRGLTVAIDEI